MKWIEDLLMAFMILERTRSVAVVMDQHFPEIKGTCVGCVVNVLHGTGSGIRYHYWYRFRKGSWNVGSKEGTIELHNKEEASKENPLRRGAG